MLSHTRPLPRASTAVLLAAPALLLAGAVLLAVPTAWTVGHAVFLGGAVLMIPAGAALHRLLDGVGPRWLRRGGLALTVVGALALSGQFVLDFVVAQLAGDDEAARSALFDRLQDTPLTSLVFYTAGPALLFTGLALSGAAMVVPRAALARPGAVLVAGTLVMALARATDQRLLEVVGLAVIVGALALAVRPSTAPVAGRAPAQPVP
jgi:hypothetical protein